MRMSLVIGAIAVSGAIAAASPATAAEKAEPLNYGRCVADGVIVPHIDYVGPRTVVNGNVNYPQADEPPGQHWEYFWGCA
jgi:hypothetical protein